MTKLLSASLILFGLALPATALAQTAPSKDLLPPVPRSQHWVPYLGHTLDAGIATLFAGEIIEADKLISATTRAAELDPHYPESYMILAEYYQLEENLAAARKAIESAVRISPNNQSAHILAAEIYLELGRKKRSMHHLNEAADFGRDTEEMRQLRDRLQGEDL